MVALEGLEYMGTCGTLLKIEKISGPSVWPHTFNFQTRLRWWCLNLKLFQFMLISTTVKQQIFVAGDFFFVCWSELVWIMQAMYFSYHGDFSEALEHYLGCRNWQKAHSIFTISVAHSLFLSGKSQKLFNCFWYRMLFICQALGFNLLMLRIWYSQFHNDMGFHFKFSASHSHRFQKEKRSSCG